MGFDQRRRRFTTNVSESSQADLVVLTSGANLRYFFDYRGESFERFCCGLVSPESAKSALVLPKLDEMKAKIASSDYVFSWADSEGYTGALRSALESIGTRNTGGVIGCEDTTTLGFMNSFKKEAEAERFVSLSNQISKLRCIKDKEEVHALKSSAKVLCASFERIPDVLKSGKTELEASFEVKKILQDKGASKVDFCAIQSGPNGAIPHAEPSKRKISHGDMIVVDISCTDESGYFADFTRTCCVGEPSSRQREVHEVVKQAQESACKEARKGIRADQVDAAARSIIEKHGYGKHFFHRTGHGLGLEVHELPWISQGNPDTLDTGMAFTIEPGIYLPGEFGVRIEDDIVLTENGPEYLSTLSHELQIV